jgi:predicted DNA-binding transcriptional regulator AlpA
MTNDDDDAFYDKRQTCELTRLSNTHLARLEKKGLFPSRVQLSGNFRTSRVGWRRKDVREWLRKRYSRHAAS